MIQNDNFTVRKFRRNPGRVMDWSYRYLTATWRALPAFLIIGTQKGGTTSLYSYLEGHPNMIGTFRKEVKFFDCNYLLGLRWYRSHFPYQSALRGKHAQTGEASPYYMYHPTALARIKKHLPDVKLIALLRNPVERAYSDYHHMFRSGRETLSFDEAISQEEDRIRGEAEKIANDPYYSVYKHMHFSYLGRGRYAEQLTRLFELFPREQVLILISEDLFSKPSFVFQRVLDFLDLPEWHPTQYRTLNQGDYSGMPSQTRQRLVSYFKPYNAQLEELLKIKLDWK